MDEDTVQRLKGGLTFVLEFYKICMGTFLTVFVPHQCYEITAQGSQPTICTVSHNVYNGDDYHRRVIWFNLFSFVVFITMYYSEVKRENWCINYLDIDYTKPSDNLDDEIELYPVFKERMRQLNKRYDVLVKACSVTQLFNIAISVADVGRSWAGSASFTPMLSYILLIATKLYTTYMVATASLKKERAFSAYLKEPKTYNTIDKDHKHVVKEGDVNIELCYSSSADSGDDIDVSAVAAVNDHAEEAATVESNAEATVESNAEATVETNAEATAEASTEAIEDATPKSDN